MRQAPFTLILGAVKWDIFATLTYRGDPPSSVESVVRHGREWLEAMKHRMEMPETEWFWFLRPERGESGGRLHLHGLLKVRPRFRTLFISPPGTLSSAHRRWGRGMTTFRTVDHYLDPVSWYVQKESIPGGEEYETVKTAACLHGVPSDALLRRASLQESEGGVDRRSGEAKGTGGRHPAPNKLGVTSGG